MKKRQYQVMREAMTTISLYGHNATHELLTTTAHIPADVLERLVTYGWCVVSNGIYCESTNYTPLNTDSSLLRVH